MTPSGPDRPCLVAFHAHPDDEAIFTGGTIAMAAAAGWRVVLVVATSGEEGARPHWLTDDLAATRRRETLASARLLGIERVAFLGYRDSGAGRRRARRPGQPGPVQPGRGQPGPGQPGPGPLRASLDATAVHKPVSDLRAILQQEGANVVTSYDRLGVYGHRDHVRVHQIAGAAVLGTACDLVEATIDRLTLRRLRHHLLERGLDPASWPRALVDSIGTDDSPGGGAGLLGVDVTAHLPQKMAAIAAHASQVVEAPTFMGLPPGVFHRLLDVEWFHPARTVDGRFAELVAPHLRSRIGSGPRTHETHNSVLAG